MAEMVLTPPLRADGREPNFLQKFGHAFVHGDIFTKLSLFVWGLGYIGHGQLIKALLVTLVQGLGLYFLGTSGIPALKKFGTLGTVQMEMQFNPLTLKNEVNNYDNSFAILLLSVIALVVIVTLIAAAMLVVQSNYALQAQKAAGKKPNNFRQDITLYLNESSTLPCSPFRCWVWLVFTIIPLFILIAVAFTNYDQQHMPPAALFTWVGLANFASLFGGQSLSLTFSYAFGRVLSWTLVWAFFATFTNFFGGVFLAMLINNKKTKCQKLWRTLFIITIAVPQFVTLLLVRNFFSDAGIFNTMMANAGVTDFLKTIGLLGQNMNHIPFLTDQHWAKFMIILINIWVGVPYQMLIATGVLMNIPTDMLEAPPSTALRRGRASSTSSCPTCSVCRARHWLRILCATSTTSTSSICSRRTLYHQGSGTGFLQRKRGGPAGHMAVPPDAGAVQLQDGRRHRHYGVHHLCRVHAGMLPVPQ